MSFAAFEQLIKPGNFELLTHPGNAVASLGEILLFTLLIVEIVIEVSKSHRLLRHFHADDKYGAPFKVLAALVASYFRSTTLLKPVTWLPNHVFEYVRRRVELSIFHRPDSLEWKNGGASAFRETDPEVDVKTSKEVASKEDKIRAYFEIVNQPIGTWDLAGWIALFAMVGGLIYWAGFGLLPAEWVKYAAMMFLVFLAALCLAAAVVVVKSKKQRARLKKGSTKS